MKEFDYRHMSKSPAVFDYTKLKMDERGVHEGHGFRQILWMAEPYLKKALTRDMDLKKIAAMVKTRIEVFPDIQSMLISLRRCRNTMWPCIPTKR
ncbi:MAG: hypothetical protein V8S98_01680 [Lachnospiraceae bacterium]